MTQTDARHGGAAGDRAFAVGRQCRRGPPGARPRSPITLNFLRWALAFVLLLPLAYGVLRPDHPVWAHWRRYALLGLLGIGLCQRAAVHGLADLHPINVTLVGSSMPVWMLAVGAVFFGVSVTRRQLAGAALSMAGVLLVLSRGEWSQLLALRLVPGDLFMLLATISWSFYSWLLVRTSEPASLRGNWAGFLMAQLVFGLGWSGALPAPNGPPDTRRPPGAGRWRRRWPSLPSARPWWRTAAGAWACSAPARRGRFFRQPHAAVCRN